MKALEKLLACTQKRPLVSVLRADDTVTILAQGTLDAAIKDHQEAGMALSTYQPKEESALLKDVSDSFRYNPDQAATFSEDLLEMVQTMVTVVGRTGEEFKPFNSEVQRKMATMIESITKLFYDGTFRQIVEAWDYRDHKAIWSGTLDIIIGLQFEDSNREVKIVVDNEDVCSPLKEHVFIPTSKEVRLIKRLMMSVLTKEDGKSYQELADYSSTPIYNDILTEFLGLVAMQYQKDK